MRKANCLVLVFLAAATSAAQERPCYQALKCPAPSAGSTWAVLDRDGANRAVEPYLSSLAQGESGRGVVSSPAFVIAADTVRFTLCGHDGPGGGAGENYIALVDVRKGKTLAQTSAPGADAMQERSWDVGKFRGVEARIELHDGDAGGAYAWFGAGQIDAWSALTVDFRQGLPAGWQVQETAHELRTEIVAGGVPFKRLANVYTLLDSRRPVEIPCGFTAQHLFVLGSTVPDAKPGDQCGAIEIVYADGHTDGVPLLVGFTLDGQYKQMSRAPTLALHRTTDPFQHYFVIATRPAPIEKLRLTAGPGALPQITAITCETSAAAETLEPLPEATIAADEAAWIKARAIAPGQVDLERLAAEIRRAYRLTAP